MNNTNQQLFVIYKNVNTFYEYRGLKSTDQELSQDQFVKKITRDKYLILNSVPKNPTNDQVGFNLVLVYPNTECETKRANMIKLINYIKEPKVDVLIITPNELSSSVNKLLASLSKSSGEHEFRTYKSFTYRLLTTILPDHELVPKYEFADKELFKEYELEELPKILENDPQMIWIGAKVGDVIKATFLSEVSIESINYRIVISSNT